MSFCFYPFLVWFISRAHGKQLSWFSHHCVRNVMPVWSIYNMSFRFWNGASVRFWTVTFDFFARRSWPCKISNGTIWFIYTVHMRIFWNASCGAAWMLWVVAPQNKNFTFSGQLSLRFWNVTFRFSYETSRVTEVSSLQISSIYFRWKIFLRHKDMIGVICQFSVIFFQNSVEWTLKGALHRIFCNFFKKIHIFILSQVYLDRSKFLHFCFKIIFASSYF